MIKSLIELGLNQALDAKSGRLAAGGKRRYSAISRKKEYCPRGGSTENCPRARASSGRSKLPVATSGAKAWQGSGAPSHHQTPA